MALWTEHIPRHVSTIHEARNIENVLELLIIETVTTETVAHMHIDHTPWCKYRFLVWIAESVEDASYTLNALLYGELVCGTSHGTDALTSFTEYVRLIETFEVLKILFSHALGHKFLP